MLTKFKMWKHTLLLQAITAWYHNEFGVCAETLALPLYIYHPAIHLSSLPLSYLQCHSAIRDRLSPLSSLFHAAIIYRIRVVEILARTLLY